MGSSSQQRVADGHSRPAAVLAGGVQKAPLIPAQQLMPSGCAAPAVPVLVSPPDSLSVSQVNSAASGQGPCPRTLLVLSPGAFGAETSAETQRPGEERAWGDPTSVFHCMEKGDTEGHGKRTRDNRHRCHKGSSDARKENNLLWVYVL